MKTTSARRFIEVGVGTLVALLLLPRPAQAATYLLCQAALKYPSCVDASSPMSAQAPLHLAATCQECEGSGSEPKCSMDEQASAAALSLDTVAGQPVAGTFSQVGTCDFGQLLFKFGGSLAPGTSYRISITVGQNPKTELLLFDTTGGGLSDGGSVVTGDGGWIRTEAGTIVPVGDGGSTASDGGWIRTEAGIVPVGDGGGHEPVPGEGGCGCAAPGRIAEPPPLLTALLGLVLLLGLAWRRRS